MQLLSGNDPTVLRSLKARMPALGSCRDIRILPAEDQTCGEGVGSMRAVALVLVPLPLAAGVKGVETEQARDRGKRERDVYD